MNIIAGYKLDYILNGCKLRFDRGLVQLDAQRYPSNSGRYILILQFYAPENLTGISSSNFEKEQIWILEREVKRRNLFQPVTRYFEFEIIDDRDSKSKLYIPTKEFLPVLLHLRNEDEHIIEKLFETVGLKDNDEITKLYDELRIRKFKENGFDKLKPKEYYDQHFGTKSDKEKELRKEAKEALNINGTGAGSSTAERCYAEIIKINPQNAYAYFNRGLAIMDSWNYEKLSYSLFDKRPMEVKEAEINKFEAKVVKNAESDFRKAIELNPYLIQDYEKLKREGRII